MIKIKFLFIVLIFANTIYAKQEPHVKFYLNDGSIKQYNISDIEYLGLIKSQNYGVLKINYQDSLAAYYPSEIITRIRFENDSTNNQLINVYVNGYPKSYFLSKIDSITFYIDVNQPLSIGNQVWMLKNLNVEHYRNGDTIPEIRDSLAWPTIITGSWCYWNNNDSIGKIYGKLYNWYAVNDIRGLAPFGWHIASDSEWNTLAVFLGGDMIAGKLKESGTNHWNKPNSGATNESGFTALPGSDRYSLSGVFANLGYFGFWWTSTESNESNAWLRYMSYGVVVFPDVFSDNNLRRIDYSKSNGYSVRCILDK